MTSYFKEYSGNNISAVDYLKNKVDDVNLRGKTIFQNYEKINEIMKKDFTYWEKSIESIHFYMGICFIFKR